jgi:hypothetical protein
MEESVYYSAGVKQVGDETEMSILFRHCCRTRGKDRQCFPLKRVPRASNPHLLR